MKKFLLVIALVFVGCPAGVLFAGSMQPAAYHVERSTEVSAPPDVVYSYVSDFHRFAEWSPWEKLDPSMQKTFEGPASGTGSIYSWSGNDKVGAGKMTITEAKPQQQVVARVEISKPWHTTNQSAWAVVGQGEHTKITWSMDGSNDGLVAKTFSLFMNMDKMVGKDYERGLEQLKTISEAEAQKRAAAPPPIAAAPTAEPGAAAARAAPAAPPTQP